jgi:hypothetical protein
MNWIKFSEPVKTQGKKTLHWYVKTADDSHFLGSVAWFTPWRRYAFMPYNGTIFEQDCLREIAAFCETKTREHRAARKEKP